MKINRRRRQSHRGYTLVELMVVMVIISILASVGIPAMQSAMEQARRSADMRNVQQLGTILMAHASESGDGRYPSTTASGAAASTSTDVFNMLYVTRYIRSVDVVYSPGQGKVKAVPTSPTTPPFTTMNVGYCYTSTDASTTPGVPLGDDDNIPLLYNSGNSTPNLSGNGAKSITLQDSGIWGKKGINVYYKNGTARTLISKTSNGTVQDFVPGSFVAPAATAGYSYKELAP